jgi:hypothetical protein
MATATILNFVQSPKFGTHYGGYSYKVSRSLMKGIPKKINPPFLFLKNSKMNRFQWKWIFTGRPFWFAMVAILNQ